MSTFAEKLSISRKRAGFTQEILADTIGISVDTVRRWEGGKRDPRLKELQLLAKTLKIPVAELIDDDDVYNKANEINSNNENQKDNPDSNTATKRPYRKRSRSKENKIIIQQGNTRLEIPADSQGYEIIREKLKEVSFNQGITSIIEE